MKKLRKKKKPSYQRRRERGTENVKKIYETKHYTRSKYGNLFDTEMKIPKDFDEQELFEMKKMRFTLKDQLGKAKERKVRILKIDNNHMRIERQKLQLVENQVNGLSDVIIFEYLIVNIFSCVKKIKDFLTKQNNLLKVTKKSQKKTCNF